MFATSVGRPAEMTSMQPMAPRTQADVDTLRPAYGFEQEARDLTEAKQYAQAESKYREAMVLRRWFGAHVPIAETGTELAEILIKLDLHNGDDGSGRLDEALELLIESELIWSPHPIGFDIILARNNIGQVYEIKGDLKKALEWRTKTSSNNQVQVLCSYVDCPRSTTSVISKLDEMKRCARCQSAIYCGDQCQKKAWKLGHKAHCRADSTSS